MSDERYQKMIQALYDAGGSLTLQDLASKIGVSVKTVRSLLAQNADTDKGTGFGVRQSRLGVCHLEVYDQERLMHFLSPWRQEQDESTSRINYMIRRLLRDGGYLRIEDLAEELFVSRITLDRLMPAIRTTAAKYDLQILTRPKHGICLVGTEMNKRICYAHCAPQNYLNSDAEMTLLVQSIVLKAIRGYALEINEINTYNLIQHCLIAIRRIRSGNIIQEVPQARFPVSIEKEQAAAQEILNEFELAFQIEIPPAEGQYITMHLLGKRVLQQSDAIQPETYACIEKIWAEIEREKHITLQTDPELLTALALHIQPLLLRLRFGLKQENPILTDIKRDMGQGYELALCAAQMLAREYGLHMGEDEAGYLALHFTLALEKQRNAKQGKKIVVVCASGRGTAKLIRYRLQARYQLGDEDIVLASVFQLPDMDFSDTLCILSTIPLPGPYPVPSILIDLTMSEASFNRMDMALKSFSAAQNKEKAAPECLIFPAQAFSDRDSILQFLCQQISDTFTMPDDLLDRVFEREALSSTEVGNEMALPHPYTYNGDTLLLAFMTLRKAVHWKYGDVRLVILMLLPASEQERSDEISDRIAQLASSPEQIRWLYSHMEQDTIITWLTGGEQG